MGGGLILKKAIVPAYLIGKIAITVFTNPSRLEVGKEAQLWKKTRAIAVR